MQVVSVLTCLTTVICAFSVNVLHLVIVIPRNLIALVPMVNSILCKITFFMCVTVVYRFEIDFCITLLYVFLRVF